MCFLSCLTCIWYRQSCLCCTQREPAPAGGFLHNLRGLVSFHFVLPRLRNPEQSRLTDRPRLRLLAGRQGLINVTPPACNSDSSTADFNSSSTHVLKLLFKDVVVFNHRGGGGGGGSCWLCSLICR